MSNADGNFPPSPSRVAKAARAGLFAKSPALVAGLGMLAFAAAIALVGDQLGRELSNLVKTGLVNALFKRDELRSQLIEALGGAALSIAPFLAAVLAAALVGAVLPAVLAKRKSGTTAVPLPPAPKARFATTVIYLFGVTLVALATVYVFKVHAAAATGLMSGDLGASASIWAAVCQALGAGGTVMLLVGLAEIAVLKTEIWRSLHLDSLEARREARAAGQGKTTMREGARRARRRA